jgi:hypothetical protein
MNGTNGFSNQIMRSARNDCLAYMADIHYQFTV